MSDLDPNSVEAIFDTRFIIHHAYYLEENISPSDFNSENQEVRSENDSLYNVDLTVYKHKIDFTEEEFFNENFNEFLIDLFFDYKIREMMILQTSNKHTSDNLFEIENNFISEYYSKFGFQRLFKEKDSNDLKHLEREDFYVKFAIPLLQKFKVNEKVDFFFEEFFKSAEVKKREGFIKEIVMRVIRIRALERLNRMEKIDERILIQETRTIIIEDLNSIIESLSIKFIKHILVSNYPYFMNVRKIQNLYSVRLNLIIISIKYLILFVVESS